MTDDLDGLDLDGDDLGDLLAAGLGFRRADEFDIEASRERNVALVAALTPPPSKRERRPTLAAQLRVIKAAEKAGLPVRSATIEGVVLEFGQPAAANATEPAVEITTPEQLRRLI